MQECHTFASNYIAIINHKIMLSSGNDDDFINDTMQHHLFASTVTPFFISKTDKDIAGKVISLRQISKFI